jgi:hypothetical protein
MRGSQAARECALAAEPILARLVTDGVVLDRILNMIELSVNQQLQMLQRGASGSTGFDPVSGAPSRSNLEYQHRARTAEELKDTAHLVPAPVQPTPESAPQPRKPVANPNRPNTDSMPWL